MKWKLLVSIGRWGKPMLDFQVVRQVVRQTNVTFNCRASCPQEKLHGSLSLSATKKNLSIALGTASVTFLVPLLNCQIPEVKAFHLKGKSKTLLEYRCSEIYRSSRSQMFFKIGVLKNFVMFTGKHLSWSLSDTGAFVWILRKF